MTDETRRAPLRQCSLVAAISANLWLVPQAAEADSYCFRAGADGATTLRLDMAENGSVQFALDSWQGGGHNCAATGKARAVKGGWVYREKIGGETCEIVLARTADGGIALTDTGNRCQPALCGARAAITGLSFPPTTQVNCASMPAG